MAPLSFIVVGSGWRAMFFVRIAKRFPELFSLKYILSRSEEKARKLTEETGIPAVASEERCLAAKPDFVVVAVAKSAIAQTAERWSRLGFPVLCETPAGSSVEELERLWRLSQEGGKIQVAEQYHRYPILASGIRRIQEGLLGEPSAVTLSVAHDYHGASLIRRMLKVGMEPVKISGRRLQTPVVETDSRQGPITDGREKLQVRDILTMEFASGKTAVYDFTGVQYHSFIRSRHLNVQGPLGEWNDTVFRYVEKKGDEWIPRQELVTPYFDPDYDMLVTPELRRLAENWNPFLTLEPEQDEYAIATMMLDMRGLINGGESRAYPLEEALEDAYLWLLMRQAAENPGTIVRSEPMPWQSENHM